MNGLKFPVPYNNKCYRYILTLRQGGRLEESSDWGE